MCLGGHSNIIFEIFYNSTYMHRHYCKYKNSGTLTFILRNKFK